MLNSLKNQPSEKLSTRDSGSRWACRGFSRIAHRAGLSVSELSAERIVETAIVRANWRKNCPVMPVMNTQGRNTQVSTRPMAISGAGDLGHGLVGGRARRQPLLDVVLGGLDHHDRVVDHDADGQHQPEQRERVEAEAHHGHGGERADDRHRHGDQRDQRRAPVLQEHEHHDRHQDHGVAERLEDLVDRFADVGRGVVEDAVLDPFRETARRVRPSSP